MRKYGLRLLYEPAARVAHNHPTDLRRFASRQERAGYGAVVFYLRHPELGAFLGVGEEGPPLMPAVWMHRARELLARALQPLPLRWPRLWEDVLRYHYIRGLNRGWHDLVTDHKSADRLAVPRAEEDNRC